MASIIVSGSKMVMYDGKNLYPSATPYVVNDTYNNYIKATKDVNNGLITISEAFNNVINTTEEQYLSVTADMSSATWNTVGVHEVFAITGGVRMKIVPECISSLTGGAGATICLGVESTTDAFIADTDVTLIDTGEVWDTAVDGTITKYGDASAMMLEKKVFDGLDVGYEVKVDALTGGVIKFHCWWIPENATGSVVAGTGVAL